MGWPDLTYRSRLEPQLKNELEQLVALTQGYLAAEHGADGQHTTITVDGIQFRGPNGEILAIISIVDGKLVVNFPPVNPPATSLDGLQVSDVLVGHHQPVRPWTLGAGIDLNTDAPPDTGGRWCLLAARDGAFSNGLVFANRAADVAANVSAGVALYYDPNPATLNGYAFCPPAAGSPVLQFKLGSRTDSRLRWDEINGKRIDASVGYYERGRTTAIGDWIPVPFNAANFVAKSGGGPWIVEAGDVSTNLYTVTGTTMIWAISLSNTVISAVAAGGLNLTIPGGYTCPWPVGAFIAQCGFVWDALGREMDYLVQNDSPTTIVIHRAGPAIPASNPFNLNFTFVLGL